MTVQCSTSLQVDNNLAAGNITTTTLFWLPYNSDTLPLLATILSNDISIPAQNNFNCGD